MSDADRSEIARRKADHIAVVLEQDVGFGRLTTGLGDVRFMHNALPELSLDAVDLGTTFLGRHLAAPLLISSMTGGPQRAAHINAALAEAAQTLRIAIGLGSQRIALEEQGTGGFGREIRRLAPDVPLLGNLGAAQLLGAGSVDRARRACDMIEADALIIHLNPLQEAVQPGGDTDWRGVLDAIAALVAADVTVVVKEVGFGLSGSVVRRLVGVGVQHIDVAGAGGTNWARVEGGRDAARGAVAAAFTDWGVPTADAIMAARAAAPGVSLIASGGIRDGVDAARALRLGADLVGQAAATLPAALQGPAAVIAHFTTLIDTLRAACFVTGSADLRALKRAPLQPGSKGA